MITERLLQFVWQFRHYTPVLYTTSGEALTVLRTGMLNTNQGPDFLDALIKIDQTLLAGHVELHVQSGDWELHGHQADVRYRNVILHVVWEDNKPLRDAYGMLIPTIALKPLVPEALLQRYRQLMQVAAGPACKNSLPVLAELSWSSWKQRLVAERLEAKAALLATSLQHTSNHWEEIMWQVTAENFGIKVNAALFNAVAKTVPVNILARHKNQLHQLEALLMGQANMLNADFTEAYPIMLQREYRYLQNKYKLTAQTIQPAYLRMRPAGFPTIRMAQLAMLVHVSGHLFSRIREATSVQEIKELFKVTANDYWHYHYRFDETSAYMPKTLGESTIHNLLINTVVPLLFGYGHLMSEQLYMDKALEYLHGIPAEDNSIIRQWKSYGIKAITAFDSQALLQLNKHYCEEKKCLQCNVGYKLLRTG
jgi:hypothetical protein